jgi:hypothetical protein
MVSATKDSNQDSKHHSHNEKDGFEPLLNENYAGKHLSDPIPEIKVKCRCIEIDNSLLVTVCNNNDNDNVYLINSQCS